MKTTKKAKITVDVLLTITIIATMFIQFTGVLLHEIIGFVFFAALITHLLLSAKWVKSTARAISEKNASARRVVLLSIGIALTITMIVLGASSIAISNILMSIGFVWGVGDYSTWAALHAFSSYALCAIVVVHLATHWAFVAHILRLKYNADHRRLISAGVYSSAIIGAGALGIAAVGEVLPSTVDNTSISVSVDATQTEISTENTPQPQEEATSPQSTAPQGTTATTSRKSRKKGGAEHYSTQPSQSTPVETLDRSEPSSALDQYKDAQQEETYTQAEDEGDATPFPTGFCTLCRKGCALSAPQCDRPYEEGLITTTQTR